MEGIRRRGRIIGALTLMLSSAACGGLQSASSASCAAPSIDDRPPGHYYAHAPTPSVNPGEGLTIYGHWYTTTCNDTGGHAPLEPLPPVHLTLTLPGGAVKPLGRFTPTGDDMGFSTAVHIPAGTPDGSAKVSDDQAYPATYTFQIAK